MKTFLLSLVLVAPLGAADAGKVDFYTSQSALLATTFADVMSSRGLVERNPILGRGNFTIANQGARALGLTGGLIAAEMLLVRRWPASSHVFHWVNFGGSAAHGFAAAHNWRQR